GFQGGVAKLILAHELTHALDDQLYDIDGTLARLGQDTDAETAFWAVVEGSGTGAMNQWLSSHVDQVDAKQAVSLAGLGSDELETMPELVWKPMLFTYMRGAAFLARTDNALVGQAKKARTADIERAFRSPPRSTEQVLHSAKYWDDAKRDEPRAVR